jgi:hypothetical protein
MLAGSLKRISVSVLCISIIKFTDCVWKVFYHTLSISTSSVGFLNCSSVFAGDFTWDLNWVFVILSHFRGSLQIGLIGFFGSKRLHYKSRVNGEVHARFCEFR